MLALLAACAAQAQPAVRASVASDTVYVGEPFAVNVSASGTRVARPVIPHAEGLVFNRTPASTSQSMQISFVNGRSVTNEAHEWVYYATPKNEGEVVIPKISVRIDGTDYFSEEIRLTVSAAPKPQQEPARAPADRQRRPGRESAQEPEQAPAESESQLSWEDVIQVDCSVDKREAYQGEAITLTLAIRQLQAPGVSVRYTGPRNLDMPSSEGFYAVPPERNERLERKGGFEYAVEEYTQRLYPMRSGQLTVGSWTWEGMAMAHTQYGPQMHEYRLNTPVISIEARPLPAPPPEFTGAVGRFHTEVRATAQAPEQGVPFDVILRVAGEGNPDAIGAPVFPALTWAHVTDPVMTVEAGREPRSFTKNFAYTVTPFEAGDFEIPPIPFAYFEPGAGEYRTETAKEIAVRVIPSQSGVVAAAPEAPQQAGSDSEKDDLLPIFFHADLLRTAPGTGPLEMALALLPPAAWLAFFLFMRRRERLARDPEYARDYYARSKSRKRLGRVEASSEPVQEIYRALTEFLADKCNVPAAGLTSNDVRGLLEQRSVAADVIDSVARILNACERDAYAAAKLSQDEVRALAHGAAAAMDRLDAVLRKGRKS